MSRKFLYQILLLVSINFLIKPFYLFGIERNIQNILPEGDYGLYFAYSTSHLFFRFSPIWGCNITIPPTLPEIRGL